MGDGTAFPCFWGDSVVGKLMLEDMISPVRILLAFLFASTLEAICPKTFAQDERDSTPDLDQA